MFELGVPIVIALATGFAALNNRLHNRIMQLDKRLDEIELRVAEKYVSKVEMSNMIDRVETHLVRLENKLDKLAFRPHNTLQ